MIKTTDMGRVRSFPDIDVLKQDGGTQNTNGSSEFQSVLQTIQNPPENRIEVSRESKVENPRDNEIDTKSPVKTESSENESKINDLKDKEAEPTSSSKEKNEKLEDSVSKTKESKETKDSTEVSKKQDSNPIPKIEKEDYAHLQTSENHKKLGMSITSILMPVFQNESKTEIFQEKMKNRNQETPKQKEIFKHTQKKDSNEIMKDLLSESKSFNKKGEDIQSKKNTEKFLPVNENQSNLKINTAKQAVEDLKNSSQILKNDENSKNSFVSIFLKPNNQDPEKLEKKNKSKSSSNEVIIERLKEEPSGKDKIFTKDNSSIQKNSKDEFTSITEKLKRVETPLKKEKEATTGDLKIESFSENKSAEKNNSPNPNTQEVKLKQSEQKTEVKSSQKTESTGRNFQEIVKAAKIQIVENGKNTAEISLQPKELGKVTLFVSQENNKLEGKLLVESENVRQMILGDISLLKEELKASGLDLFELTVELNYETPYKFSSSDEKNKKNEDFSNSFSGNKSEHLEEGLVLEENMQTDRMLDLKV